MNKIMKVNHLLTFLSHLKLTLYIDIKKIDSIVKIFLSQQIYHHILFK